MSKGALNLECGGPFHLDPNLVLDPEPEVATEPDFDLDAPEEVDDGMEGARYGNAFHELLANLLKLGDIGGWNSRWEIAERFSCDPHELSEHVAQSKKTLDSWLSGENPYGINFFPRRFEIELPLALSMTSKSVRVCTPTNPQTHVYPDVDYKCEYPGTADLLIRPFRGRGAIPKFGPSPDTAALASGFPSWAKTPKASRDAIKLYGNYVLILDHKTGQHVPPPHELPQLWALALAGIRLTGARGAILATLHAPRGGAPSVYCSPSEIEADKLERFGKNLAKAWSRIGDGSIRPGPHCTELFCPRYEECEIHRPALLQLGLGPQPIMEQSNFGGHLPARLTEQPGVAASHVPVMIPKEPALSMRPYVAAKPDHEAFALSLETATPSEIARIAAGLTEFGRLAKALKEPLRERIKALNAQGETISAYEASGKRLDVISVSKRTVSIKSITEACGAGEVAKLTKAGAIKEITYERIQTKNDS